MLEQIAIAIVCVLALVAFRLVQWRLKSRTPTEQLPLFSGGFSAAQLSKRVQVVSARFQALLGKNQFAEWAQPTAFANVDRGKLTEANLSEDERSDIAAADKAAAIVDSTPYEEAAEPVRRLARSGLFSADDLLRQNCVTSGLFHVHHRCASGLEGGLAIRTTVQLNLFGGSVANLGTREQRQWLQGVLDRGELGCFGLTEGGAGVLSGLIVDTTATWSPKGYKLTSEQPVERSRKTWISSGLVARWAVVIARLVLPEEHGGDKGPHVFVVDLDSQGVHREDMSRKGAFNGLDNAHLSFTDVHLPHSALLSGLSRVSETTGEYELSDPDRPFRFEHVAQRLLSGRVCIAGAALSYLDALCDATERYGSDERFIPTGKEARTPLARMPCVRDLLVKVRAVSRAMHQYVDLLEQDYAGVDDLTTELVDEICAAKFLVMEHVMRSMTALKERTGAWPLMADSAFGRAHVEDLMLVFAVAEGDVAVLRQKMVRDQLRPLRSPAKLASTAASVAVDVLTGGRAGLRRASVNIDLIRLALRMKSAGRGDGAIRRWLEEHALVERIARQLAGLRIYTKLEPSMRGTAELECFAQLYVDNLGTVLC